MHQTFPPPPHPPAPLSPSLSLSPLHRCTLCSALVRVARLLYPPTRTEYPSVAYPRTSRNELIRQSDEGRAAACIYVYIPMPDEARRNSVASIYRLTKERRKTERVPCGPANEARNSVSYIGNRESKVNISAVASEITRCYSKLLD